MKKDGIYFKSFAVHRIKIGGNKFMQIGKRVFLKNDDGLVVINNVDNVFVNKDYLYFKALGLVFIEFDCEEIFRFFNLKIYSKNFNLQKLKQLAMMDLFNTLFNKKNSKMLKKYINIIKNVLNINIFEKKLVIKQNKFKLSYTLVYKLNNKIKRININ